MALIRDPGFWRRFSLAVHRDEEAKGAADNREQEQSIYSHAWIKRQQQKKRRTITYGVLIAAIICVVVAAVVIVLWWFGTHHWLHGVEREHS